MDITPLPIVVIGAGPVGLAAAAHLLARGQTPIVLLGSCALLLTMARGRSFRHRLHDGSLPMRAVSPVPTLEANTAQADRSAASGVEGSGGPVSTCCWERGEEQPIHPEGQAFHSGTMFLHWMPVH